VPLQRPTFRLPGDYLPCDEGCVILWEHHTEPLASHRVFLGRLARQLLFALGLVIATLGVGVFGYMEIAGLNLVDAFLESSMLLSGAGPLYTERSSSNALKVFSSFYALFSTLVVVAMVGLMATPMVHRVLHRLHQRHSQV
jgi:hypothetical protein